MNTAIFTLTSELHDQQTVAALTQDFLSTLEIPYILKENDFSDYGSYDLNLIFVRTGGTEGIFRRLLPQLTAQSSAPFYLLTAGKSNSLAASLEILAYLRQQGLQGEILHGTPYYVTNRICTLGRAEQARRKLNGQRLGIIGKPSDWLISSTVDPAAVRERTGIELVEIPMSELLETIEKIPEPSEADKNMLTTVNKALPGAHRIYQALKTLVKKYQLQGFTLRCFDLLDTVHNTGCWALAKLNEEGYVAGCEGDVPAMLSMVIARALCGTSGFQSNPATINPETGEILFAHCTIPFDMVRDYELDTHYESGIGVGIRGRVMEGPATIFKISGDLSRCFITEGTLLPHQPEPDLCRTQLLLRLDNAELTDYFLTNPISNHHIIVPGRHAAAFHALLKLLI